MGDENSSSKELDLEAVVLSLTQTKWLKIARIYGDIFDLETRRTNRDLSPEEQDRLWESCAIAINALVARGEVETQGDISRPRHSEIRLSPRMSQ